MNCTCITRMLRHNLLILHGILTISCC